MKNLSEMCFEQIKVKNGKCVEYGMMREGVYERDDENREVIFGEERMKEIGLDDGVWMVVSEWDMEEGNVDESEIEIDYIDERGGWEGYVRLE